MIQEGDSVYLSHILNCIQRIEEYTGNGSEEDFMKSNMAQDAVMRQLEIIGEASNQLSKQITGLHVQIPWEDMVGMRNKLIHDYLGVDVDQVWKTVTDDIPFLKQEVKKILSV